MWGEGDGAWGWKQRTGIISCPLKPTELARSKARHGSVLTGFPPRFTAPYFDPQREHGRETNILARRWPAFKLHRQPGWKNLPLCCLIIFFSLKRHLSLFFVRSLVPFRFVSSLECRLFPWMRVDEIADRTENVLPDPLVVFPAIG